ncbi:iron uptake porin [Pannus brasiliensis CCIBt3594]|uniref:Iron uptake porin n=1 Tax=Pannus brasiliensis CCIBt3594 TaxID=1427578 RepID=A0AAW9QW00_9CHRO
MKSWKTLATAFALVGCATPVLANGLDQLQTNPMAQVTSVNQLRDVSPSAWAYEALRSLVERYGCIVGYPDRTFRGDRALTRWEFAAGLNACLNTLERMIQDGVAVAKEDIDKLKRLASEFQSELAAMGARIDNLENRAAFLEDHQFSTTTKLAGEVVMAMYGVAAGEKNGGESIPQVPAFGYRARLELNTSFTGKDLLYTRLATGNIPDLAETTGTFQSTLAFTQPDDNDLALEVLYYRFPVAENINLWLEAFGGAKDDFTDTLNFLDGDGGSGALSSFGTRNPIYYQSGQTGLGFQGKFGVFEIDAGYLAGNANDPNPGNGLFNGSYSTIIQLDYIPSDNFGIGLTYLHAYNLLDTGTGSQRSNFQFYTEDLFGEPVPTTNDSYGLEFSWRIVDGFVLGGWGGYTKATTLSTLDGQLDRGTLDIWNWAVTFAFPDLFKEGNVAGLIFGMQPWVSNSSIRLSDGSRTNDPNTSFHIEGFYQWAITNNIAITPGLIVITAPDYNDNNSTLVIGTIRTTFTF